MRSVSLRLKAAREVERLLERRALYAPVEKRSALAIGIIADIAREARIENGVDQRRFARERGADLRRQPKSIGDGAEQDRLRREQRKHLHAGWEALQEIVEPCEGGIGLTALGDRAQQFRHQRGEDFPRAFGAGGANAAVMPTAHGGRDALRMAEAPAPRAWRGFRNHPRRQ
ncbi:MAG: hypothetical protein WDN76_06755 [Alphaproteobacteria bacterium]